MTLSVSFHEDAQREFDEVTDFYAMERVYMAGLLVPHVARLGARPRAIHVYTLRAGGLAIPS